MTNRQFDRLAEQAVTGMAEEFLPHQAHEFSAAFEAELLSNLPENGTASPARRTIRVPWKLLSGAAACLAAAVSAALCLNRWVWRAGVSVQTSTPEVEVVHPSGSDGMVNPTPAVYRWADFFSSDSYPDGQLTQTLAAFPDTEFRWRDYSIYAAENGEETQLIYGMPVWNAFFTDLNGDGYPELCAGVSFGSGMVDEHIEVYDYYNRQLYTLWDRGEYDYLLGYDETNDMLVVTRQRYPSYSFGEDQAEPEIGRLVLEDDELHFVQ